MSSEALLPAPQSVAAVAHRLGTTRPYLASNYIFELGRRYSRIVGFKAGDWSPVSGIRLFRLSQVIERWLTQYEAGEGDWYHHISIPSSVSRLSEELRKHPAVIEEVTATRELLALLQGLPPAVAAYVDVLIFARTQRRLSGAAVVLCEGFNDWCEADDPELLILQITMDDVARIALSRAEAGDWLTAEELSAWMGVLARFQSELMLGGLFSN